MQVFPSFIRYFKYGHFYGGIAQFIAGLIEYKKAIHSVQLHLPLTVCFGLH